MLFAPFAGDAVCRRVANPDVAHGTPNMEPLHALDGASWLWHPELAGAEPGFVLFRLNVKSTRAETVRLQVSADLCYTPGSRRRGVIARGPDTGDKSHWSYATYELKLSAGAHRLEALIWWAATPQAPEGRMTWRGGFACAGLGAVRMRASRRARRLWKAARLDGLAWGKKLNRSYHVIGCSAQMDLAKFDPSPCEVGETIRRARSGRRQSLWRARARLAAAALGAAGAAA